MRRGFKTWAENQAKEQRQNLGLNADAPLPARRLAARLEIPIFGPKQIPGMSAEHLDCLLQQDPLSWSAVTVPVDTGAFIIHNTEHAKTRQESNLMHEMAHLLCKHTPIGFNRMEGLPFLIREYDPEQEEEAAWLGGCLQLPRPALLWAIKRRMTLDEMVRYFCASSDLIQYRRGKTGVNLQFSRQLAK